MDDATFLPLVIFLAGIYFGMCLSAWIMSVQEWYARRTEAKTVRRMLL